MLRYKIELAWFSRLVRHPTRKWSGSILTTPEPARGCRTTGNWLSPGWQIDLRHSIHRAVHAVCVTCVCMFICTTIMTTTTTTTTTTTRATSVSS